MVTSFLPLLTDRTTEAGRPSSYFPRFFEIDSAIAVCLRCGMANELLDYLRPDERETLSESQKLRLKSRTDAVYYGAVIKQIMDRARARRKAKGENA